MQGEVHPDLVRVLERRPTITITPRNLRLVRLLFRIVALGGGPGGWRRASGDDRARVGEVRVRRETVGRVPVRFTCPPDRRPLAAVLWFHGGGFVVGTPRHEDHWCSRMAGELNAIVVAPQYRLAPENPFPAGLEDGLAVWNWLVDRARSCGIGAARLAVGGRSAGGCLAASLTHALRDTGAVLPAAQLLVYPMLDDRTAVRPEIGLREHLVWNRESNMTGWGSYLGLPPGSGEPPRNSVPARCTDLQGLPPAWIGVGSLDLFARESAEYARRLIDAGVSCELAQISGAYHGFDSLAPTAPVSRGFRQAQIDFLRAQLVDNQ